MRDKTYDFWMEYKECWRVCGAKSFSLWVEAANDRWWSMLASNPHGWNTKTRAKYAKGFKRC